MTQQQSHILYIKKAWLVSLVVWLVCCVAAVEECSARGRATNGKDGQRLTNITDQFSSIIYSGVDSFAVNMVNRDYKKAAFWHDAIYRAVNDSNSYYAYRVIDSWSHRPDAENYEYEAELLRAIDHFDLQDDTFSIKMTVLGQCVLGQYKMITDEGSADKCFKSAMMYSSRIGDEELTIYCQVLLTDAYIVQQRLVEAASYARRVLSSSDHLSSPVMRFSAQTQLYQIYTLLRVNSMVEFYGKQIEKEEFYTQNLLFESRYLLLKGDYLIRKGMYEEAYEGGERLIQTCELSGTPFQIWRVNLHMAKILSGLNRLEEAQKYINYCKYSTYYTRQKKCVTSYSSYHVDLVEAFVNLKQCRYEKARDILLNSNPPEKMLERYGYGILYYRCLENVYTSLGNYREAVKMVEKANKLRERTYARHTEQRSRDLNNIYQSDTVIINQDATLIRKEKDLTIAQKNFAFWALGAVLIIALIVMIRLVIKRIRRKKEERIDIERRARLEYEVNRQTQQLKEQKNEISKRNKDIIMSQSYARVIQEGVLPDVSELKCPEFGGSFVIYKPVDVVSGDFYWFRRFGQYLVVCCADCSGRGVPGAMMTMVGLTLLNDITAHRKDYVASALLEDLDTALLNMMPDIRRSDSIDVTIAVIDIDTRRVNVSSANQEYIVCRGDEVTSHSGSRRHVGFASVRGEVDHFRDDYYECEKGDKLYLYTDGVTSLSGGKFGDNLTSARFVDILQKCNESNVESRPGRIEKMLDDWSKGFESKDDYSIVCIEL